MSKLTNRDVQDAATALQFLSSVGFTNATLRYRIRHNLRKLSPIFEDVTATLQECAEKFAKRNSEDEIIRVDNGVRIADPTGHRKEVREVLALEVLDMSDILPIKREWLEKESGKAERKVAQPDGTSKSEKYFFTADVDAALGELITGDEPVEAPHG